ncbi:hypothetical protein PV963_42355 [Streptomyces coeruleorubidus]|uniref:hypothetical protein n=1 Tax=Streptomyces coeruleorubidus TaxID=116188 RepID=UPI00237F892B|nr:hypothetical protein [Streptomyces coeruleorubidus]WDV56507.1 hypothetical protein PV963_42355 [Streptomyces coeruleorubidus]
MRPRASAGCWAGDPGIRQFESRQPADTLEFSSRHAVFAATDGIWPRFYVLEARAAADPGGFPWFEEPGRASLRT